MEKENNEDLQEQNNIIRIDIVEKVKEILPEDDKIFDLAEQIGRAHV